jgi:hypothetical protein
MLQKVIYSLFIFMSLEFYIFYVFYIILINIFGRTYYSTMVVMGVMKGCNPSQAMNVALSLLQQTLQTPSRPHRQLQIETPVPEKGPT